MPTSSRRGMETCRHLPAVRKWFTASSRRRAGKLKFLFLASFLFLAIIFLAIIAPGLLVAQLTTGVLEGVLRGPGGHPLSRSEVVVSGGVGFRASIHTNGTGEFALVLPYGEYRVSSEVLPSALTVFVPPLETVRINLEARPHPGLWTDVTRGRVYPEGFALQGVLLSREPASVSVPLDFDGLSDNRLALESQRGFSWTGTQYRLLGIDATDSYQPGRPSIAPDIQALDAIVVRSAFDQTASTSDGTEVGLFLAQPAASWHGALSSIDTGSPLASTNLPAADQRGIVEQSELFHWMTRDTLQIGGPLTKWADLFAAGTAQWSSQTVPLATPGHDRQSRLQYGNIRGRIRASAKDQIDALYSGSRIDLSEGGMPAGVEALEAWRMMPSFVLPGGFPDQAEVDHLDFVEVGWTHQLPSASGLGAIQVRYGYSTAHLDTRPLATGIQQSSIELLGGEITGPPPIDNFAIRTHHEIEGTWQPAALRTGTVRHQIVVGAGWKTAAPRNRITAPSNMFLITADGAPAFVVDLNTPLDSRERVRSSSIYAADHLNLTSSLSVDVGGLADFSRGFLPGGSNLIAWNSFSPRAGFAWRVPHTHGLILRGAVFRLDTPLAARYLDYGNPNSLAGSEYQWIDRNGDGMFESGEQGALVQRFGGQYSSISPSLHRPYSDEFDVGAEFPLARRSYVAIDLFRRDDKKRIAAIDNGVPASAFTPVPILDPGPDGISGTYDDQKMAVYAQNPATFGQDHYLLTNPAGLRMLNTGLVAEIGTEWRGLALHASFVAEKSYGPTNPGDSVIENDPGVAGALFLDPNTAINASNRSYVDRGIVGKIQASYRFPSAWSGVEIASVANYVDGLVFARQLLVTGLPQGPFLVATTVRGSPEGGNRAEYVPNWNLRVSRGFEMPFGKITVSADVMNATNSSHRVQENDLSGTSFNLRLPVEIQPARYVRAGFRYEF